MKNIMLNYMFKKSDYSSITLKMFSLKFLRMKIFNNLDFYKIFKDINRIYFNIDLDFFFFFLPLQLLYCFAFFWGVTSILLIPDETAKKRHFVFYWILDWIHKTCPMAYTFAELAAKASLFMLSSTSHCDRAKSSWKISYKYFSILSNWKKFEFQGNIIHLLLFSIVHWWPKWIQKSVVA